MREKSKKQTTLSTVDLKEALIKKALGYDQTEVVEEYVSGEEGEIKLTKKKVTKKNVPPDITALKILLEGQEQPLSEMTDEQLKEEKVRLLKLLEKEQKKEKK
ncbi:MAG: hypothetical protein E7347_03860 [Clostridiales bacterium]|nr:hypothetical protein [Clostridiales bacterium]